MIYFCKVSWYEDRVRKYENGMLDLTMLPSTNHASICRLYKSQNYYYEPQEDFTIDFMIALPTVEN